MAGACGRSNRSQSKAMIFSPGVRIFFSYLRIYNKNKILLTINNRR